MPCESRITQTKMLDAGRLAEVLCAAGFLVEATDLRVRATRAGQVVDYARRATSEGFAEYAGGVPAKTLAEVGLAYAQATTRAWAKQNGLNVRSMTGQKALLVSVRGT